MLNFDAERLESAVAALPAEPPGLSPESTVRFRQARARVGRHHGQWRESLPSMLEMFDDDAHQAKALAGNLATELGGVLRTGVGIALGPGGGARSKEIAAWVEESAVEWRRVVGEALGLPEWESEPRDVFEAFLDELTDRGRDASHNLISAGRTSARELPVVVAATGLLTRLLRPLVRLFRPDGNR